MKDFTISINSDGRVEAFYIDDAGRVQHLWQKTEDNRTDWTQPSELNPENGVNISNVVELSAAVSSSVKGKIQVVAQTSNGDYYVCYQTVTGYWQGWFKISQS